MSRKPILSFIAVVLLVGCKSQPRNEYDYYPNHAEPPFA